MYSYFSLSYGKANAIQRTKWNIQLIQFSSKSIINSEKIIVGTYDI